MGDTAPRNSACLALILAFALGSGVVRAASPDDGDADGWTPAGGDCDDANDLVYPGAFDRWYDGLDADCDGADDFDRDGDGWPIPDDCADLDPNIHPDVEEVLDDVDQNCDGFTDPQYAVVPRGGAACGHAPVPYVWGLIGLLVRRRR